MKFPSPVIDEIEGLFVVRDDLILGGTKRRVLDSLITPGKEYVYASPAFGYAQVALGHCCRDVGATAVIFTAKRQRLHKRTEEAAAAGARVVQVPYGYLSNVQSKARQYCEETGANYFPFGFDCELFVQLLSEEAGRTTVKPDEVWCAAGSGTLSRALQRAWPAAIVHAVAVGAEPDVGSAVLHRAPEKFEADARCPPPFPSCSNYDAKVWQFASRLASRGALVWNVAG